jgi:hypothetical protein
MKLGLLRVSMVCAFVAGGATVHCGTPTFLIAGDGGVDATTGSASGSGSAPGSGSSSQKCGPDLTPHCGPGLSCCIPLSDAADQAGTCVVGLTCQNDTYELCYTAGNCPGGLECCTKDGHDFGFCGECASASGSGTGSHSGSGTGTGSGSGTGSHSGSGTGTGSGSGVGTPACTDPTECPTGGTHCCATLVDGGVEDGHCVSTDCSGSQVQLCTPGPNPDCNASLVCCTKTGTGVGACIPTASCLGLGTGGH